MLSEMNVYEGLCSALLKKEQATMYLIFGNFRVALTRNKVDKCYKHD